MSRMSNRVLLASTALVAGLGASPALARDSWGKPNVGFAEYRLDSDECSEEAFHTKLWVEPIYQIIRAIYQYSIDIYSYARAHDIARHGVTVTIAEQLQNAIDTCLIDRGYQRFRLTEAQDRQLSHLRRDTIELAYFLYGLGSAPAVMTA